MYVVFSVFSMLVEDLKVSLICKKVILYICNLEVRFRLSICIFFWSSKLILKTLGVSECQDFHKILLLGNGIMFSIRGYFVDRSYLLSDMEYWICNHWLYRFNSSFKREEILRCWRWELLIDVG